MHQLLHLADAQRVRVVERPGRTRGGYDPTTRTIRLAPGMSARTTRSVLAHELGHACLGHFPRRHRPHERSRSVRPTNGRRPA